MNSTNMRIVSEITEKVALMMEADDVTTASTAADSLMSDAGNISMDDLYPALVQCFGIIVCG